MQNVNLLTVMFPSHTFQHPSIWFHIPIRLFGPDSVVKPAPRLEALHFVGFEKTGHAALGGRKVSCIERHSIHFVCHTDEGNVSKVSVWDSCNTNKSFEQHLVHTFLQIILHKNGSEDTSSAISSTHNQLTSLSRASRKACPVHLQRL